MHVWLFGAALLAALVLSVSNVDHSAEGLDEERLQLLDQRIDRLARRIDQLEGLQASSVEQGSESASMVTGSGGVEWRLAAELSGQPLLTTATDFDKGRGIIELLLKIQSPLFDADAWPREPGRSVPILLRAEDATGARLAELLMSLVRGPSQEPGAYLHLRAQLPDGAGDLVRVIRIDRR